MIPSLTLRQGAGHLGKPDSSQNMAVVRPVLAWARSGAKG